MELEELGFNQKLDKFRIEQNIDINQIGRIIAEHKERYIIKTIQDEYEGEITGNMRFSAMGREDFPAVGDWVNITTYESNFAIIHNIFPRFSVIKRQAVGKFGEIQIIATNIDCAFIIQAIDRDFNINRIERYLTICNASKVTPIIVLTKIDLIEQDELYRIIDEIKYRIKNVPIIAISSVSQAGFDELKAFIEKGKTYCMLGSSGVGKSTLLNSLSGKDIMRTDAISVSTNKGRHVTSHRELTVLSSGGILIDNPGMREVGIADSQSGLEITFDLIAEISQNCKFADCTHTGEIGCAVHAAIENGDIDQTSYENYLKIEKENAYFESTVVEKRQKDKEFGKFMKNYKKDIKKNKFK